VGFRPSSIRGDLPRLYVLILFVFIIFRVVVVLVEVLVVFVVVRIVVIKNVIEAANVGRCHDAGSVAGFGLSRFGGG
jgi:ABC-type microcin C transport system permease subunit YejE